MRVCGDIKMEQKRLLHEMANSKYSRFQLSDLKTMW